MRDLLVPRDAGRTPQSLPQGVKSLPVGDQLLRKFGPPRRMGEIPGSNQPDSLSARPQFEQFGNRVPAGGAGLARVDMQICDYHKRSLLSVDSRSCEVFRTLRSAAGAPPLGPATFEKVGETF